MPTGYFPLNCLNRAKPPQNSRKCLFLLRNDQNKGKLYGMDNKWGLCKIVAHLFKRLSLGILMPKGKHQYTLVSVVRIKAANLSLKYTNVRRCLREGRFVVKTFPAILKYFRAICPVDISRRVRSDLGNSLEFGFNVDENT